MKYPVLSNVIRRLHAWLLDRLPSGTDGESDGRERWDAERSVCVGESTDDEGGGFIMSRLDYSVLVVHGFGVAVRRRRTGSQERPGEGADAVGRAARGLSRRSVGESWPPDLNNRVILIRI